MIEARLQDGRILRFPDGTDQGIIQNTVKKLLSESIPKTGRRTFEIGNNGQSIETENKYTLGEKLVGATEVLGSLASGSIIEPIAGLIGAAAMAQPVLNPNMRTDEDLASRGTRTIENIRKMQYQPTTSAGKEYAKKIGETLQPVGEVIQKIEKKLGDFTYEKTKSPALASLATTIPSAMIEALPFALPPALKSAKNAIKSKILNKSIDNILTEATPTIDTLKTAAREIYNEIDNSGVVVKPEAYSVLVDKIEKKAIKNGLDKDITPGSFRAVKRLTELNDKPVKLTDLDIRRKIANNIKNPTNSADSNIANMITSEIDDFMDNIDPTKILTGDIKDTGIKYKIARKLWGQAKRSEMIEEAFYKARNAKSGFENGLRDQFKSINSEKKRKFFKDYELKEMETVVRGKSKSNIAKLIGKFGIAGGSGHFQILGPSLGAGIGASLFGPSGAVLFPMIGQVSKSLAKRLTENQARFADQIIRAGNDARKIAAAYLKNTPKSEINPSELSQLLMNPDINLVTIQDIGILGKAKTITLSNRQKLAGILAASQIKDNEESQ